MTLPEAKSESLDQFLDDLAYKSAIDMTAKITKELVTKVLKINGVGAPFNQPWVSLYGEYAKRFTELMFATFKQEPIWLRYVALDKELRKHIDFVAKLIKQSPIPEIKTNGILVLLTSLIDYRVAHFLKKQKYELAENVNLIMESLDNLIKTNSTLDRMTATFVKDTSSTLIQFKSQNNFDRVFVEVGLGEKVKDLCNTADELLRVTQTLVRHRNNWAELVQKPRLEINNHNKLIGVCYDIGF